MPRETPQIRANTRCLGTFFTEMFFTEGGTIMITKVRFFAVTLTLVLVSSVFAMSGAAQDASPQPAATTEVDVQVQPNPTGALSVSITDVVDFAEITYANTERTVSGASLSVTAVDDTGAGAGWNVTIGASNFTSATTASVIPAAGLTLTSGTLANNTQGNAVSPGTVATSVTLSSTQTLMTAAAGQGNGSFTLPLSASLTVPAGTLAGTYTSTLTVTITGNTPG